MWPECDLPLKTDPIFKLGLGYNKKDIKGGKRYEQEAIYDGADYWFTSGDDVKISQGKNVGRYAVI